MKRSNVHRSELVVVGLMAAMVLNGGRAKADFTFGEVTNMGSPVNSSAPETSLCISADGLELYIEAERPGGYGLSDLWVTTRQSKNDDWGTPANLGPEINTSTYDWSPCLSADDLSLYFISGGGGSGGHDGYGDNDVYVTTRASRTEPWGEPVNLGPLVNTSANDGTATISSYGLELYYYSDRPGKHGVRDIWVAKRTTVSEPWGEPVNLGPIVNRSTYNICPSLSSDGLRLFYSSGSGSGSMGLWMAKRTAKDTSWVESVNLGLDYGGTFPYISRDGLTLYFCDYAGGQRPPGGLGSNDLWQVPIIPIVDLNGDGIVDAEDMYIMIDHWGEDYPLCDIGPMPWGDGVVDVEDLKVLADHLFEEVDDPTLIAHWPLNETEGMVVTDSAGNNDGYALGDPIWQPNGGQVDGALQLDGVDDYVVTGFAPKPEMGSYSVLAWIKGGAPGQAVLSQMGKANWLCANPSEGFLMTELTVAGRDSRSLGSEAVITDGNWHRIGFVWDGSYRRLYVYGVVVAEDVQDNLDISSNSLYFGTGKTMQPGTFWAGLIDDVRIYNRAVHP